MKANGKSKNACKTSIGPERSIIWADFFRLTMQLFAIGINHHTAPLALRERIVFPIEVLGAALGRLRQEVLSSTPATQCESAILSTCNRTEIYLAAPSVATPEIVIDWLCREHISCGVHAPAIGTSCRIKRETVCRIIL